MRLLVVDDEPRIGLTLRMLLDDHDVTVVHSGSEAQATLSGGAEFDGVLCDLTLTDIDGAALLVWIAQERPELAERVVVMTGGAITPAGRQLMSELPEERRLQKPFTPAEIRAAIAPFA